MNLQTLKGFRDFLPSELIERNILLGKIRSTFEKFGFDPLETPALEYAEVLTGKYGEDADKLLYMFEDRGGRKVGLRYDQTVPTARVVAQYANELPKPFKRYQIQPVWRAENTQKGRYREFLQCDADIIGEVYSPLADAEILSLLYSIYSEIGFKNFQIIVNSRAVLEQMIKSSNSMTQADFLSAVRSIDKMDKIGLDGVVEELKTKQIPNLDLDKLTKSLNDFSRCSWDELKEKEGCNDLYYSLQMAITNFGVPEDFIKFDPTLARGLDYYTGLIFEVKVEGYSGSLGGGGRYDNLIGQLGGPQTPAIGFAIGFDRTLEIAKELQLINPQTTNTQVLVTYEDDGQDVFPAALNLTQKLRSQGINTEIYLTPKDSLDKQRKYGYKKAVTWIIGITAELLTKNTIKLKTLSNQKEEIININQLDDYLKQ